MGLETPPQHASLAAGRWGRLTLAERMAHIGGEVERALNWRLKNNAEYAERAFERALELLDLTLACDRDRARLREVARVREALVDFFHGTNEYGGSAVAWRKYFMPFVYAARRHRNVATENAPRS